MSEIQLQEALVALRDLGLGARAPDTLDARCRAALQREVERERAGTRLRVRRRRGVVVPVTALLVAALGATGYAALSGSSEPSAGIECHSAASLDGGGTITHLDGGAATATCARLWASGSVADGAHAAPAPLHACVAADGGGAIHVLPSADGDVCARVGLREQPRAGEDAAARAYGRFAARLTERLNGSAFACPSAAQMQALVEAELAASDLTGWSVARRGTYDADRPCASLALDGEQRTATISPVGR